MQPSHRVSFSGMKGQTLEDVRTTAKACGKHKIVIQENEGMQRLIVEFDKLTDAFDAVMQSDENIKAEFDG